MNLPLGLTISTNVYYILLAFGLAFGLIGIILLVIPTRAARLTGGLLFPFLPSVILFAIFPTSNVATIDAVGKLGGPIAAYLILAIWTSRTVVQAAQDADIVRRYAKLVDDERLRVPVPAGIAAEYAVGDDAGQRIVVLQGDLRHLLEEHVAPHVIVNSENDYLMLGRPFDRNVSGLLRYLDAMLDEGGRIRDDSLEVNLKARLANLSLPVAIGSVFNTPTTGLAPRGVKYILHIATVTSTPGKGYRAHPDQIESCIRRVYEHLKQMHERATDGQPLESVLLPLIGTGEGGLEPIEAARLIVPTVERQMRKYPFVKTTYILAFRGIDRDAVLEAAKSCGFTAVPTLERSTLRDTVALLSR